ncbi:MAG: EthD family reductase [Pseudomonadales bacterium]
MIKVSVLYPSSEGSTFDIDYYVNSHMPLVAEKVGSAIKGVSVDEGLGGPEPGSAPAYMAMGHMLYESVEAFQTAFGPHMEEILADLPNFTNAQPTIQISEVKL